MGPPRAGRFSAIAGIPGDTQTYYAGAASGGVWKAGDSGQNWEPVFDEQPVQAIGALAVSRSNPAAVWAGTGEAWAIRDADVMGNGVYKSTDAGKTWAHMGLDETGRIGRMLIHPTNPDIVFACVLAPDDERALAARLSQSRSRLAPGSASALAFAIDELGRQRAILQPYDVATTLRLSLDRVVADLARAESGVDPIASRTGVLRRAYRSALDGTLRPYSIRVPADYRPDTPRPLLVYLHGSGEDDRGQLDRAWLPSDMIVLAPNGRGTSNWYTRDGAQDDIREAIADVAASYAVDSSRIVLAGFSMGGYGVYRTLLQDPGRFRALAVFSGLPYVPGRPADAPDLLKAGADLSVFGRVPIFVFHGGKDRNCPIEDTRALVETLQRQGGRVEFHLEPDKGHEAAGEETLRAFSAWLRSAVAAAPASR